MTSKANHMNRSRRSYGITKSILGSVEARSYHSRASRQSNADRARVFKPIGKRLTDLKDKLSDNVGKMFRKQER